jgi:CubicO group peptidase (beta-lactamase class C family)
LAGYILQTISGQPFAEYVEDKLLLPVGMVNSSFDMTKIRANPNRQAGGLGWIAGLVFVAVGVLYLLQQFDILPTFANWWALFLLLPGVGVLSAALGAYRRSGGQ